MAHRRLRDRKRGGASWRQVLNETGALLTVERGILFVIITIATVGSARLLGAREYGVFATGIAIGYVVTVFGTAGIDQLQLFHGMRLPDARRHVLTVALLTISVLVACASLWPNLSIAARLCVLLLGVSLIAKFLLVPWYVDPQTRLEFNARAQREFATGAIAAIVLVATAITRSAVLTALASCLIWLVLAAIAGAYNAGLPQLRGLTSTLRSGWPYATSAALYTVYFTIDAAILAAFRPAFDVGQYRAAYNVVMAAILLPVVVNNDVLRARLARRIGDFWSRIRLVRRYGVFTAAAGAITSIVLVFGGPPALRIIYGSQFHLASRLIVILALGMLPHYVNSWAGNALVGLRRMPYVLRVQFLLLVWNVALNIALIPLYGVWAAAATTVATEIVGVFAYLPAIASNLRSRATPA